LFHSPRCYAAAFIAYGMTRKRAARNMRRHAMPRFFITPIDFALIFSLLLPFSLFSPLLRYFRRHDIFHDTPLMLMIFSTAFFDAGY
jgi:hypothetical protein